MAQSRAVPTLLQVVLDTTDARGLAEFYRRLLGYEYRPRDEPPDKRPAIVATLGEVENNLTSIE